MALTPKQRKAALEKGLSTTIASPDDAKYLSPNPKAATQLFFSSKSKTVPLRILPADGMPNVEPKDKVKRQTVDRKYYRQTVSQAKEETGDFLPADRKSDVKEQDNSAVPLAPIQWAIWEALCAAQAQNKVISYRKLAQAAKSSIRGARDALAVIEKEGGIRSKVTVRTPDEQGMLIEIEAEIQFRSASLKETKGLVKREGIYRQTVNR